MTIPAVPGAHAIALGVDGVLMLGTNEGRLVGIDPEDDETPLVELQPADDEPITGLALEVGPTATHLFVRTHTLQPDLTRVTRFALDGPRSLAPSLPIEVIAVDNAADTRHGAGLMVAEGRLWLPLGDGESGDQVGPANDPNHRSGNLLRLDVANLVSYHGYEIPTDNPMADEGGAAAETWAWGLRDPAACAIDPENGRVWCADAGAGSSEASLVPAAANLGWPHLEGTDCLLFGGCENVDSTLPQGTYRHGDDDCGVGSAAIAYGLDPELEGALVYSDRCSGRLFAVRPATPTQPRTRAIVGDLDAAVVAMVPDPAGGIWALDDEGQLGHIVVRRPEGLFPLKLADSGCLPTLDTPAPDLVPYELNAPLWTDGSHKQRHLVLPPGAQISVAEDGTLTFPEGTLILKTFSYALDPFEPEVITPVETRVMIRRSFTWEFHSYAWDEEGVQAQLLDEGESRTLLTSLEGAPTIIRHTFPSRDECGYCHGSGDAHALGPRLDQLARTVDYGATVGSQLDALAEIDFFDGPLPAVAPVTNFRDPDASAEDRARAYLHANCGHCHRPGGWTPPLTMDLRWSTPTIDTALCGVEPEYASTFFAEHRIAPGDLANSLVWLRVSSRGLWQMPPFATSVPDPDAEVVRWWIEQLEACPGEG